MKWIAKFVMVAFVAAPAHAAPMRMVDILETDPLGYECIPATYFEETDPNIAAVAFQVSEKMQLARTCLPNPCDRALDRRELAGLTGTSPVDPRFPGQWNDYYARYADHCRREVNPVPSDVDMIAASEDFWEPLISPGPDQMTQLLNGTDRSTPVIAPTRSSTPVPTIFPSPNVLASDPPTRRTPIVIVENDDTPREVLPEIAVLDGPEDETDGEDTTDNDFPITDVLEDEGSPPVAAVPVPGALLLVLTALGLAGILRHGRRLA